VSWDDPATTPADDFRFDICGSVSEPIAENAFGVVNGEIPGGRCAWRAITARWIRSRKASGLSTATGYRRRAGETLRDFPLFFRYLNFVHEVGEHELQTDIYLPLR
jgi:AraC family transcriptional regulator